MKEIPLEGLLLAIRRIDEASLRVTITTEGFELTPELWGSLLGDVFKHVVAGFQTVHGYEETAVVQTIMGAFVHEIAHADEAEPGKSDKMPYLLPGTDREDN